MRAYSQLFALPEFRVLFFTRCLAMSSMAMASLALGTITYESTGSTVLTALALFGGPLITLIGSATVLGASDSLRPRTAMLLVAASGLLAHSLQAIPGLPWQARFVILAIPYVVNSATGGTVMRLLPLIVGKDGFLLGRSTLNAAVGIFQIVGYGSGGLLLAWFSSSQLFGLAAVIDLGLLVAIRLGIRDRPASRPLAGVVGRTRAVNRDLLGSRITRPLYLCMWIPNGLIVGCEALFVPLTAEGHDGSTMGQAGFLFAVTAAGMLLGDIVMGRFVPARFRDRLLEPLRLLLAAPYLLLFMDPPMTVILVLAFVSAIGYSASLPLQERLLHATGEERRGQSFGLAMNGMMIGQSLGALVGGVLAGFVAVPTAMGILGALSLAVTVALTPGLRRSRIVSDQAEVRSSPSGTASQPTA